MGMAKAMNETTVHLHSAFVLDRVDERIFGGFLEHLGRAVYGGVFDPQSSQADANGFRSDVMGALRRLKMTAMRYPGGNFASGYHWTDGIGPRTGRPAVRELAWQSTESNHFGTDEYVCLCREMGWTPMITVNLGTGTPEEARNWVEYCNSPAGTRYADLRAANGSPQPHGVKLWCLGNEMDGYWQLGHVPAEQYAIRAQQAGKMMKDTDRAIELVVCGSCGAKMPTYMEWDRQVLAHVGDLANYISLHRYVGNPSNDTPDFLAVGASIDRQIQDMNAVCRFVQAQRRSPKRAYLCFDEWNVWYRNAETDGRGKTAPQMLEEIYNLEDALVVAQFLNSFIRHADIVKIANLAQIVNVIAPVLTRGNDLLLQSIFHPFEMISRRRTGLAIRPVVDGRQYESKSHGTVCAVDASAILDGARLHVFLVNRTDREEMVAIAPADLTVAGLEDAEVLSASDPKTCNTFEQPDAIRPAAYDDVRITSGVAAMKLPALSFVAATLRLQ